MRFREEIIQRSGEEQVALATALSNAILLQFTNAVAEGKVPDTWSGMEIRQWFYEQWQREQSGLVQRLLSARTKRGKAFRARRYNGGF
jgi:pyridoxine/pyridoxamine 5'-phosphate oxidase